MKRAFIAILLLLVFLLSGVGSASAYIDAEPKNRVGDFFGGNNEVIWKNQLPALGNTRGNHFSRYDSATGVWDYVVQNPWSKFDPLGLTVNEKKVKKKPVIKNLKQPRHRDYVKKGMKGDARKKAMKGFKDAVAAYKKLKPVNDSNRQFNEDNTSKIMAWEGYERVKSMMSGSSAWNKIWNYLDEDTITVNGKEYKLNVNVSMQNLGGEQGRVNAPKLVNGEYVVDVLMDTGTFSNSNFGTDAGGSGMVDWHTLPHEFDHAVERVGAISVGGLYQADPISIGTYIPDEKPVKYRGGILMPHESRATRAGNIVAGQLGRKVMSTHYVNKDIPIKVPQHKGTR